jgi:4-amino-4-deoxy-L-arabinose transferase-like glycosyltransferase
LFDSRFRSRIWWPAISALAVLVYFYSLDGPHAPHIGDEAPYIQIVRLTAASGEWLPLKAVSELENTKPPLLFWLGILSTDWGRHWTLFRLRFPIVICTFLTAGLVFLLASRMTRNRENGYLAALSFLGFATSFQYGRPFLTNLPETLFVFLPFFLLLYFRDRAESWATWFWIVVGFTVGVACLFKSFVLVVPVGFALGWHFLSERDWSLSAFLRRDAHKIALALLLSLMCFTLWPALDPHPELVVKQFVLKENVSKLGGDGYVSGLFSGPYPVYRIWLGNLANAGLFALPLIYLAVSRVKRRTEMGREEQSLWILVLSFLIVYTIPTQRQENYLIPTMPALAVLLGVHWRSIKRQWFYLFNVPVILVLAGLTVVIYSTAADVLPPGSYQKWQLAVPALGLLLAASGFAFNRTSPHTFHLLVFLVLATVSCGLAPFDGPAGRYGPETVSALRDKTVFVPSNFISKYERHRFLLPGVEIKGYHPSDGAGVSALLRSGEIVAVNRPTGQSVKRSFHIYGTRLDLRTRHSREELSKILLHDRLDLLVEQEIIIQRRKHYRK